MVLKLTPVTLDHGGVLDAVDVPIVVLRDDFTIAGFNRAAAEVFGLLPSDVGRAASEIRILSTIAHLREWCSEVAATSLPRRHDFRHSDKSYVVRIAPYKSSDRDYRRHRSHVHQRHRIPRQH